MNFLGKKEQSISIVLDIGNASVGGSLVTFNKNQTPKILYTTRVPIPINEKVDENDLTRLMSDSLGLVFKNISKAGLKHLNFLNIHKKNIKSIHCVLASPWFMAETKTEIIEKPVTLTPEYIKDLVQKEKESFQKNIDVSGNIKLLEQKIIDTKLNGYSTSKPYGKNADKSEITFFLSIVPQRILDIVEKHSDVNFAIDDVSYYSFSLVAYKTFMDIFPEDSNAVIFDITGEVTDMSIIEQDSLVKIGSVPIGRNTIARELAKRKGVTNNIALSYLDTYASGDTNLTLTFDIDKAIESVKSVWDKEIINFLQRISGKTIFITSDSKIFRSYLAGTDPKEVIDINPGHFKGLVDTAQGIKEDIFLSTDVFFVNKLLDHV
ncbi:MAG: hypothetical protein MRY49_01300 [Candidatus Pacebacteria bacterium]|nr:hypothetical protein [Candidatus Paceibacterota bacterium]